MTAAYALASRDPDAPSESEGEPLGYSQPRDGVFMESESESESDSEAGEYLGTFMPFPRTSAH
jgi:hypothetical protein